MWFVDLSLLTKIEFTFSMSLPAHCSCPLAKAVAASVLDA